MPYVPVGGGEDLAILNLTNPTRPRHVLVGGAIGTRYNAGSPRSQRVAKTIIKQNPLLQLVLYQYADGVWVKVVF